jgi:hypothetical protein
MTATSTTFTYAQLEALWIQAGGPAADAPTAAAVAWAESQGNALAAYPGTTVQPGQGSNTNATGLWQILGVPPGFTPSQLTDPLANAQMAVAKYKAAGNSFTPWVTYTSGAYLPYLSNSTPPDPNGVPTATLDSASSTTGPCGATCLWCVGGGKAFGVVSVPSYCIVSYTGARQLLGGALMVAGALLVLPGLIILVAAGFKATPLSGAASQLSRVPVYGRAVRGLT